MSGALATPHSRLSADAKFEFTQTAEGRFSACLHNHGRHPAEAVVHLQVNHQSAEHGQLRSAHLAPLNAHVSGLKRVLDLLAEEQSYQEARDEAHRATIESTALRTLVKALLEWATLLSLSLGQVALLKRLFSDGRPTTGVLGLRRLGSGRGESPRAGLLGV